MKKQLHSLSALCMALWLSLSLWVPAAADGGDYRDLGTLRVSINGAVYESPVLRDSQDHFYLPAGAVRETLGTGFRETAVNGHAWVDVTEQTDSCVYDEALGALYLWNSPAAIIQDFLYGQLGTPSDETVTYAEFFRMLDTAVSLADSTKLSGWREKYPAARVSNEEMNRLGGTALLLLLATDLGGGYAEFNGDWHPINDRIGDAVWEEMNRAYTEKLQTLLPSLYNDGNGPVPFLYTPYPKAGLGGFAEAEYVYDGNWDVFGVAYRYCIGRLSLYNGAPLLDYDEAANSMRFGDPLTRREAVAALSRFLDSDESAPHLLGGTLSLADPDNRDILYHCDSNILTPELLQWAESHMPALPDQWHGGVLSPQEDYESRSIDVQRAELTVRKLSEYGFNCCRFMLTYQTLFDKDVTTVRLSELRKLDQVVAAALRYNIHLNLVTFSMPGRWSNHSADYVTSGEFDLFVNETRQAQAQAVWELLAERYRDVPASALSFQPLWEVLNRNLSTGCKAPDYGPENVAPVYRALADTIHAISPNRLVIYEPTATNIAEDTQNESAHIQTAMEKDPHGPVQLLTNFCSIAYVYAEMPPTNIGADIDNHTHAMFKPPYPVTVYAVQPEVTPSTPLLLRNVPAGTEVTIYLGVSINGATVTFSADGTVLDQKSLESAVANPGAPLSGLYPYATSDCSLTVTVPDDTETLSVSLENVGDPVFRWCGIRWCGIRIRLPEKYAQERWWFPSPYDDFTGGGSGEVQPPSLRSTSEILISPMGGDDGSIPITLHPESLSYTTECIADSANCDTALHWGEVISAFAPGSATRIERAAFSIGTDYASALAYYGDVLDMCDEYGLGWFTNDTAFNELFRSWVGPDDTNYAGAHFTPCAGGSVLKDLLALYQSHMPLDGTFGLSEVYPPEGSQVLLATYTPEGRLLRVETYPGAAWPAAAEANQRAFLVDAAFRPLEPTR